MTREPSATEVAIELAFARGALKALQAARDALRACESLEESRECLDAMIDGASIRLPVLRDALFSAETREAAREAL